MSFFGPQNPGLGLYQLTLEEQLFVQGLASLSYENGDLIIYNSGDTDRLAIGSRENQILQTLSGLPGWGVALTVSSSAPSSPAVNDLWYDIS